MGITERVERLNRVLEAVNAWHDANRDDEVANGGPSRAGVADAGAGPGARGQGADEPGGTARPLERLVDDLLPVRFEGTEPLGASITVVEELGLGYHLGAAVERVARAPREGSEGVGSLREAVWLIERYIALLERRPVGADLHRTSARLAENGDAIERLSALSAALDAERAALPTAEPSEHDPVAPDPDTDAAPAVAVERDESEPVSFGREVALMAARWAIIAAAVILVVLAVTLIGGWV